jgi:hypothetical protein
MKQSTFLYILIFLFVCLSLITYRLCDIVYYEKQYSNSITASNYDVQVVLPEEYMEITPESHLVGYYNKRQNRLYLAFTDDRKDNSTNKNIDSTNTANHK